MLRYAFAVITIAALITVTWNAMPHSSIAADSPKLLRHVVLFKFKDDAPPTEVEKIVDAFRALPAKIPQIHSYEDGFNNSPEKLNDGLTHCFLVTFRSEADREAYLPHPEHQKFVEILKPQLEKVLVVDYWTSK